MLVITLVLLMRMAIQQVMVLLITQEIFFLEKELEQVRKIITVSL